MAVDVHAHVVPPSLGGAVRAGRAPDGIRVEAKDTGDVFHLEADHRANPVIGPLTDLDAREAWMDRRGVDHQLLSVWADLYGYGLDPDTGAAWSRLVNEHLLATVADRPRLWALATLPLQAPEAAVSILASARADGFVGAVVGTETPAHQLDAPELLPVWEAAAEHGVPLFVHPGYCRDPRLGDHGLVNAVGRGVDTTVAVARLLLSGVPQRIDGLSLVLAHGGGTLPYLLGRLARNHEIVAGTADPREGFARLWFDSLVFDVGALELLCRLASPGQVVCGSDYPFSIGDLDPTAVVHRAHLGAHDVDELLSGAATRLFGLPAG